MTQLAWNNLAHYFNDQSVIIVGSGPTDYDYRELSSSDGNIILLNDAMRIPVTRDGIVDKLWGVSHHPEEHILDRTMQPNLIPWFPTLTKIFTSVAEYERKYIKQPFVPYFSYTMVGPVLDPIALTHSIMNDYMGRLHQHANALFGAWGTVTTAIYTAWLFGCNRIMFIGCTPGSEGYDTRLVTHNVKPDDLGCVWHNQEFLIDFFKIKAEYV